MRKMTTQLSVGDAVDFVVLFFPQTYCLAVKHVSVLQDFLKHRIFCPLNISVFEI